MISLVDFFRKTAELHQPPPSCLEIEYKNGTAVAQDAIGENLQFTACSLPFPWKLHQMLDDAATEQVESVVSWIPEGNGFRVHDVKTFVNRVMPRYFNQTKYKSFQRQLNMWGFERVSCGHAKGGYVHKSFVRGVPSLCQLMRRQKIKGVSRNSLHLEVKPNVVPSSHEGGSGSRPPLSLSSSSVSQKERDENFCSSSQELLETSYSLMEFEGRTFFAPGECLEEMADEKPQEQGSLHQASAAVNISHQSQRRYSLGFLVPC